MYYFINASGIRAGAMRAVDRKEVGRPKGISPLFVMPEYRNPGCAQRAIALAEKIHGDPSWESGTVLQEKGNCHL